jgi:uncharacterized protein with HEPN domain
VSSFDDAVTATHLVDACRDIAVFVRGIEEDAFYRDRLLTAAVCFKFAVLGEATWRLSDELHDRFPDIPWRDIRNMRNRVVHSYDNIDLVEVWRTSTIDVPVLLEQLGQIQAKLTLDR